MTRLELIVQPEDDGRLLGDVLRRRGGMSRRGVTHAKYVEDGILLDGVRARTNAVVRAGQALSVTLDDLPEKIAGCTVAADAGGVEPDAVDILYEDDDLVVVNKPAGMVMYPGPGHAGETLGNVMLARTAAAGRAATLHPVHRLDGGTSGAVVFAYNAFAQHRLQAALHTADFVREYVAFTVGVPEPREGVVRGAIARVGFAPSVFCAVPEDDPRGKFAVTHYAVEAVGEVEGADGSRCRLARVRLRLETGRTHQIRIHMAQLGCPLAGDATYGAGDFAYFGENGGTTAVPACAICAAAGAGAAPESASDLHVLRRPALHSACVDLTQPLTGERLHVECPLPEDLRLLAFAAGFAE